MNTSPRERIHLLLTSLTYLNTKIYSCSEDIGISLDTFTTHKIEDKDTYLEYISNMGIPIISNLLEAIQYFHEK